MQGNSSLGSVAVTGATGFVGRRFLAACQRAGIPLVALTRTPQPPRPGVRWIEGDLFESGALARLIDGARCVVHIAGATKALRREDFHRINAASTAELGRLCARAGVDRFIFLSSLAATRPDASPYAASKAAAEASVKEHAGQMQLAIIRAPAVLGPDDTATTSLFRQIAHGFLAVPASARDLRFSIIDVEDLCDLLLQCATTANWTAAGADGICEPYGHRSLDWPILAECAGRVLGRKVRTVYLPYPVARAVVHAADLIAAVRQKAQVLSVDKLGEMNAGDWIGRHPIDAPLQLDATIERCLAPHMVRKLKAS